MQYRTLGLIALAALFAAPTITHAVTYNTLSGNKPLVLGHRGASGYRPEHTLAAYQLAITQGADYIEPDLVLTKDGIPIARHEPLLAAVSFNGNPLPVANEFTTSNIATIPYFAGKNRERVVDGLTVNGWWTDDFTLAELRDNGVKARERIPAIRPANVAFNDQFEIPTLQEVIDLAKSQSIATGRTIGVYPETKHPTFFQTNAANRTNPARFEDTVVSVLHANYPNAATSPVFIQSFEVANLQYVKTQTNLKIVQLFGGATGRPYDFVVAGDTRTYGDLLTATGLDAINDYAFGIGPTRDLLIPRPGNVLGSPTNAVDLAHAAGLEVHAYTFRAENNFLSNAFRIGSDLTALGNYQAETLLYLNLGIDGFFTDHPDLGVLAVNAIPEPTALALLLPTLPLLSRRRR